MINERTGENIEKVPVISEPKIYIYIMLSQSGLIKIGKTGNIKQRITSLSGSNSKGDSISKVYCSDETYLYTIERMMHSIYQKNRIKGTEWFHDLEFMEVCQRLNEIMYSESYEKCNEIRKQFAEQHKDWASCTDENTEHDDSIPEYVPEVRKP